MALRKRTRLRPPGKPEIVGVLLLALLIAGSIVSLLIFARESTALTRREAPPVTASNAAVPLTEEGLRRVLNDMRVAFDYEETDTLGHAPLSRQDQSALALIDGGGGGEAVPVLNVSRGNGAITLTLQNPANLRDSGNSRRSAGFWPVMSPFGYPPDSPFAAWFSVTLLAYVATLIYFTAIYPSWRSDAMPSPPAAHPRVF